MLKKVLVAASLALLAGGFARPAKAEAVFLEPYGNMFSAGHHFTGGYAEDTNQQFFASPFFRTTNFGGGVDMTSYGVGVGYANSSAKWPFVLSASFFNTNLDTPFGDADFFSVDFTGKLVVYSGENKPTISLVGRFQNYDDLGQIYDLLLAADHGLGKNAWVSLNLGWQSADPELGGSVDDFVIRFGAGYMINPKLSIVADYTLDNDVDGEDLWTVSATYKLSTATAIRFGGGKHETFFGNIIWKSDWK